MALDMTPEQRDIGKANFDRSVHELANPPERAGLTRRSFMKGLLAAGAAVPLSAAAYFGYTRLHGRPVKAGLIGATRSLAQELAKRHITVNAVAPGLIDTEMLKDLPLDEVTRRIPMRRLGRAVEVAKLVAFLASDDAAYITGQVISINGGLA